MLAAYATAINPDDPLSGLEVGERPDPEPRERLDDRHRQGGGAQPPRPVVAARRRPERGQAADDPRLRRRGTRRGRQRGRGPRRDHHRLLARRRDARPAPLAALRAPPGHAGRAVAVPKRNVIPKPPELSFEHAACLPTAWLTAYRMLFTRGGVTPGMTVLVQGAAGGVATALTVLGSAAGARVWVTSRSEEQARRGAEARRRPGLRVRRAPARARRRGDGDGRHRRPGATRSARSSPAARWSSPAPPRAGAAGRAQPRVLPAALGGRLDDGHPRRARAADPLLPGARHPARDPAPRCRSPTPARAFRPCSRATSSARSSSRPSSTAPASEDDQDAAAQAAGVHRRLRLAGPLGRILAGHAQLELALRGQRAAAPAAIRCAPAPRARTPGGPRCRARSRCRPSRAPPPSGRRRGSAGTPRGRAGRCRSSAATPSGSISRTAATSPSPRGSTTSAPKPRTSSASSGLASAITRSPAPWPAGSRRTASRPAPPRDEQRLARRRAQAARARAAP